MSALTLRPPPEGDLLQRPAQKPAEAVLYKYPPVTFWPRQQTGIRVHTSPL